MRANVLLQDAPFALEGADVSFEGAFISFQLDLGFS
jgi:hypothetical protein